VEDVFRRGCCGNVVHDSAEYMKDPTVDAVQGRGPASFRPRSMVSVRARTRRKSTSCGSASLTSGIPDVWLSNCLTVIGPGGLSAAVNPGMTWLTGLSRPMRLTSTSLSTVTAAMVLVTLAISTRSVGCAGVKATSSRTPYALDHSPSGHRTWTAAATAP
jgi:hypothetical protein